MDTPLGRPTLARSTTRAVAHLTRSTTRAGTVGYTVALATWRMLHFRLGPSAHPIYRAGFMVLFSQETLVPPRCAPAARCPLPAARCPLPAARCPLPAARCPLPAARRPPPAARRPPPAARGRRSDGQTVRRSAIPGSPFRWLRRGGGQPRPPTFPAKRALQNHRAMIVPPKRKVSRNLVVGTLSRPTMTARAGIPADPLASAIRPGLRYRAGRTIWSVRGVLRQHGPQRRLQFREAEHVA
jgi:hypothetical protein